jgi:hypothetical protein
MRKNKITKTTAEERETGSIAAHSIVVEYLRCCAPQSVQDAFRATGFLKMDPESGRNARTRAWMHREDRDLITIMRTQYPANWRGAEAIQAANAKIWQPIEGG